MAKKRKKRVVKRDLEGEFLNAWNMYYPKNTPLKEYKFHYQRLWRFDFAWVTRKVALEVQGMGPGHCTLKGMTQDYDKLFAATLANWRVLYVTSTHLDSVRIRATCDTIARILGIEENPKMKFYIPVDKRK